MFAYELGSSRVRWPRLTPSSAGEDFVNTTELLEFLPGETMKEITIAIFDNFQVESSEIFQVSLSVLQDRVALLQTHLNITIQDNDGECSPSTLETIPANMVLCVPELTI